MEKKREVEILGFIIEVHGRYMYPAFNGNAEFKVTHDGFRKLSRYLRNIKWVQALLHS